jgi:hypothetical protein
MFWPAKTGGREGIAEFSVGPILVTPKQQDVGELGKGSVHAVSIHIQPLSAIL